MLNRFNIQIEDRMPQHQENPFKKSRTSSKRTATPLHITPATTSCTSKKFPQTPDSFDASTHRRIDATQRHRFSEIQFFTSAPDDPSPHPASKIWPISAPPPRPMGAAITTSQRLRLGAFLGLLGTVLHGTHPL